VWVRCSDPDVVAGVHEQRTAASPIEVSLKYKCGPSPSASRFLLLVYDDVWMHSLRETWEVVVHSLQRLDVHALVRQSSAARITLKTEERGTHGLVQCFSSAPELKLTPEAPFTMAIGALNEVSLALRPTAPGRRQYVVHAVDLQRRALLSSWLVCANSRLPAVTKAFTLTVPLHLGANKKVALTNSYAHPAEFFFDTDRPDELSFKQVSLVVPPGEVRHIGLRFAARPDGVPCTSKIFVFVNDHEDKNEECMEISVAYANITTEE